MVALITLAAFLHLQIFFLSPIFHWIGVATFCGFFVSAYRHRNWENRLISITGVVCALLGLFQASLLAVSLVRYGLIGGLATLPLALSPGGRKFLRSTFQKGRLGRFEITLVAVISLGSAASLVGWGYWSENMGLAGSMMTGLRELPKALVLGVLIPAYAFLNACAEEFTFRGILLSSLSSVASRNTTNLLQAMAFGAVHVEAGFPNGKVGYAMVVIYGMILGNLMRRSKGLAAPIVAHFFADLTLLYFLCSVYL